MLRNYLLNSTAREERQQRRRALLQTFLKNRQANFNLDKPLRTWLRTRPFLQFQSQGHTFAVTFNTDGDLSRIPRRVLPPVTEGFDSASGVPDTYLALLSNACILPPPNQYLCGCCWALSTCSAMTDQFSLRQPGCTGPWKTMSTTHALACFPFCAEVDDTSACNRETPPPSAQCGGGNVGDLAKWISENGITTTDCASYAWCETDPSCTDMTRNTTSTTLNQNIPNCSCTDPLYRVTNVESIFLDASQVSDPDQVARVQTAIKQQILKSGPVVATINVFHCFMSGNYQTLGPAKNPQNLYMESGCTSADNAFVGSHGVCVMGWGQAQVHQDYFSADQQSHLTFDSNGMTTIPYWSCRNSFGTDWGLNKGYFNLPLFPFAHNTAIEASVTFTPPTGPPVTSNGVVAFDPVM